MLKLDIQLPPLHMSIVSHLIVSGKYGLCNTKIIYKLHYLSLYTEDAIFKKVVQCSKYEIIHILNQNENMEAYIPI